MTVAPQLLHLLQFPPPSLQCILFEGNGMKSLTTSTVDAIIQRRGIVVVLDVTSGVLKSRQKTRDVLDNRVRSISWLAGDNTRASNVAKQACRNCCTVKNDTETDRFTRENFAVRTMDDCPATSVFSLTQLSQMIS